MNLLRILLGGPPSKHARPRPHAHPRPQRNPPLPRPRLIAFGRNLAGLVAVSGSAKVVHALTSPTNPHLPLALGVLPGMVANGTNYSDGLRKAIDLLAQAPPGFAREIIVLCDGVDNVEREALLGQVHRARGMNARIDAVAIGHDKAGHSFDFSRLIAMTRPTGGRVMGVGSLKALQERFEGLAARGGRDLGRAVAKVLVMDVSPSMTEAWDRSTKLACAQLAAARWLAIEAKMQ